MIDLVRIYVRIVLTMALLAVASPSLGTVPVGSFQRDLRTIVVLSELAKSYTLATGELVSLKVSELITSFRMMGEMPVLAGYDKKEDRIGILLFGAAGGVDDPKQVLSQFRLKLEPIRGLIEMLHGIELQEEDFMLVYYDASKLEPVLQWRDGEYKMM